MALAASATARREPSVAWQPWVIAFVLLVVAIIHLQIADAGFRDTFSEKPVLALIRGLARIPIVYARLLADHLPAVPIAAAAFALVALAWWASIGVSRERLTKAVEWLGVIIAVLSVAWFLRFGKNDWTYIRDWQKDWGYYSTLKTAAESLRLPLYSRNAVEDRTPNQRTERYLANAETPAGPHAVLLAFMEIRDFYLLHALLIAAIGAAGLVALRRELDLAPFAWTLFLIVCFLNGHVTTRLREGSTPWVGFWLLPWVFLGLVRLRQGDVGKRNCAMLALCLGGLLMIGSLHIFFWSLMLIGLSMIGRDMPIRFTARMLAFAAAIGAYRLLPAILTFGGGQNDFIGGFESPTALLLSLIGEAGSGERDYFVSWAGVGLMAVGLIPASTKSKTAADALRWPCVAFWILSIGDIYGKTLFHLPGFISQRVAMRFAIVGALGLLLAGSRQIQHWPAWRHTRPTLLTSAALAAAATLVVQLVLSAELARPPLAELAPAAFDNLKTELFEPAYVWSVWIGLVASAIATAIAVRDLRVTSPAAGASARLRASESAPRFPR